MKKKLFLFLIIGLAFSIAGLQTAQALTFDLNYEYSGGTLPAGPGPWLTATFDDDPTLNIGLDPGNVRLTMDAHGLTGNEFVSEWSFNLGSLSSPDFDLLAGGLGFIPVDTAAVDGGITPILASDSYINFSSGQNFNKAGPDGYYDLRFDFPNTNKDLGILRFTADETVVVDLFLKDPPITGDFITLISENFNYESEPGKDKDGNKDDKGPFFLSAAHIQAIGSNDDSGWIAPNPNPVPEPATMLLVGMGLIGLAGFGRRRFKA